MLMAQRCATLTQRAGHVGICSILRQGSLTQCLRTVCQQSPSSAAAATLFTVKHDDVNMPPRRLSNGLLKPYSSSSLKLCMGRFYSSLFSLPTGTSIIRSYSTDTKDTFKGDLVYRGNLSGMIKGVKIFSLSTSVIGLCLQPYLFLNTGELPVALKFAVGGIVNFFIFINPFIIHYIAKKYVTDVYWNRQTGVFTAATMSFFLRRKEIQFTAADVTVPDIPGMFTVVEVKGTPLFLVPQDYLTKDAYIHLMGYDKPLEWELPSEQTEEKRQAKN